MTNTFGTAQYRYSYLVSSLSGVMTDMHVGLAWSFLGAFQGYPPRSDYQPEGGYQGYSNGYTSSSSNFGTKRGGGGGGGGPPRGAMRGTASGGLFAFFFLPLSPQLLKLSFYHILHLH